LFKASAKLVYIRAQGKEIIKPLHHFPLSSSFACDLKKKKSCKVRVERLEFYSNKNKKKNKGSPC
jgi:hypothetical protein